MSTQQDTEFYSIEYDDGKNLKRDDVNTDHYISKKVQLKEIEVDPGYELESVSPRDLYYLDKLRSRFASRRDETLSFYELKAACYKIGNELKVPVSDFQIIHILRNLWRVGYTRRFIRGKAQSKKIGRGEYFGVHYILYPLKD